MPRPVRSSPDSHRAVWLEAALEGAAFFIPLSRFWPDLNLSVASFESVPF